MGYVAVDEDKLHVVLDGTFSKKELLEIVSQLRDPTEEEVALSLRWRDYWANKARCGSI